MAQRFGLTWWGQRWISALERLGAQYDNRLPRGRTYARKGTVHDLDPAPGQVTALVDGSRRQPYRVVITLKEFDDDTWEAIVDALARQVRHAAELLGGRMPEHVDDTLRDVGVSLFPTAADLQTSCSCPDWANPCKHVAAVHYVLAARFDDDPFLLMALRGRDRDSLLAGLRARRAGGAVTAAVEPDEVDAIALADLVPAMLFADVEVAEVEIMPDRGDVLAILHRLGPLPGPLRGSQSDVEHAVEAASVAAWRLLRGTGDHDPTDHDPTDHDPTDGEGPG